jgi:hypothetical protein
VEEGRVSTEVPVAVRKRSIAEPTPKEAERPQSQSILGSSARLASAAGAGEPQRLRDVEHFGG